MGPWVEVSEGELRQSQEERRAALVEPATDGVAAVSSDVVNSHAE